MKGAIEGFQLTQKKNLVCKSVCQTCFSIAFGVTKAFLKHPSRIQQNSLLKTPPDDSLLNKISEMCFYKHDAKLHTDTRTKYLN